MRCLSDPKLRQEASCKHPYRSIFKALDFQGIEGNPTTRASIEKHVAELERRFGRVAACRVVLKGPGGHHQTGGLYEVNIRLALPDGRDVNVARTPKADERHADLPFAINDAFKRARRRLQDEVRRLQGQVKQHEKQPIGTVTRLDESGEFGFLSPVMLRSSSGAGEKLLTIWHRKAF